MHGATSGRLTGLLGDMARAQLELGRFDDAIATAQRALLTDKAVREPEVRADLEALVAKGRGAAQGG